MQKTGGKGDPVKKVEKKFMTSKGHWRREKNVSCTRMHDTVSQVCAVERQSIVHELETVPLYCFFNISH